MIAHEQLEIKVRDSPIDSKIVITLYDGEDAYPLLDQCSRPPRQ